MVLSHPQPPFPRADIDATRLPFHGPYLRVFAVVKRIARLASRSRRARAALGPRRPRQPCRPLALSEFEDARSDFSDRCGPFSWRRPTRRRGTRDRRVGLNVAVRPGHAPHVASPRRDRRRLRRRAGRLRRGARRDAHRGGARAGRRDLRGDASGGPAVRLRVRPPARDPAPPRLRGARARRDDLHRPARRRPPQGPAGLSRRDRSLRMVRGRLPGWLPGRRAGPGELPARVGRRRQALRRRRSRAQQRRPPRRPLRGRRRAARRRSTPRPRPLLGRPGPMALTLEVARPGQPYEILRVDRPL